MSNITSTQLKESVEKLTYYFYSKDKESNPLLYKGMAKYLLNKNPMLIYPYPIVSLQEVLEAINIIIEAEPDSKTLLNSFLIYHSEEKDIELVQSKEDLDNYLSWFAIKHQISVKQLKEDITYLNMCNSFSYLSKAKRLQVGEMLVTTEGVISPGYNGTAPNMNNTCEYEQENGNLVSYPDVICGLQNAVYKAAREGLSVKGSTAYSTHSPCLRCVPIAISLQVKRFVYMTKYRLTDHLKQLDEVGIKHLLISNQLVKLFYKFN